MVLAAGKGSARACDGAELVLPGNLACLAILILSEKAEVAAKAQHDPMGD